MRPSSLRKILSVHPGGAPHSSRITYPIVSSPSPSWRLHPNNSESRECSRRSWHTCFFHFFQVAHEREPRVDSENQTRPSGGIRQGSHSSAGGPTFSTGGGVGCGVGSRVTVKLVTGAKGRFWLAMLPPILDGFDRQAVICDRGLVPASFTLRCRFLRSPFGGVELFSESSK